MGTKEQHVTNARPMLAVSKELVPNQGSVSAMQAGEDSYAKEVNILITSNKSYNFIFTT